MPNRYPYATLVGGGEKWNFRSEFGNWRDLVGTSNVIEDGEPCRIRRDRVKGQ
jgi:hypothetical protein